MITSRLKRYIVPVETECDKQQFDKLNKLIINSQQELLASRSLTYSATQRIIDGIKLMRKRASDLNRKYRIKRKVN